MQIDELIDMDIVRNYLSAFADKHNITFVSKGECGFGRPCVGFSKNDNYIDYCPTDMNIYEPIPHLEDGRLYPPDDVNAYHKHNCLVVLVEDDDYDEALKQLFYWIKHIEQQGAIEIVPYNTGATGIQAMVTGAKGYAIKLAELPKPGQIWQHFKGHKYQVVGLFQHSETQELMVGYISASETLDNTSGWVRPAKMWQDQINRDGYHGARFKLEGTHS